MIIRTATVEDWPAIYPFLRTTMDEGRTYAWPAGQPFDEAHAWWMEKPPGRTVVAVDDGTVLGSAKMGPNRPGNGNHIGTASFLVAPEARGKGVARALAGEVVRWHRSEGYRGIQFNAVVETNAPAVHLWQSLGWEVVGTVPGAFQHPEDGYVGLHVMFKDLTGA